VPGRQSSFLDRTFRTVIALRWWVIGIYAILTPVAVHYALRVGSDSSIEGLIVQGEPEYIQAAAFNRVFGEAEYVLLLVEAPDPFTPSVVTHVEALERELNRIERVQAHSILSVYRRSHPGFEPTPEGASALRAFATGTDLFRKQAMVGEGFLGISVGLEVQSPGERDRMLARIETAIQAAAPASGDGGILRRVGGPYVDSYLEGETSRAAPRYFPLFGLFIVALNLSLYRSFRALLAFLATLAVCVALAVGYAGLVGYQYSIVASLVPLTVLITATSTLVYIHSRFVEHPEGRTVEDHQVLALVNKFLPCTASVFATAVGFAALAVSKIRPIREMGLWVAVALLLTWIVVFTLFPALQRVLATPTQQKRRVAGQWFHRLTERLPAFSYRWRWPLVCGSVVLWVLGAVALFGIPGLLPPMKLHTDALEYINPESEVYRDHRRLEQVIAGLSVSEIWLEHPDGTVTDPEILRGLDAFGRELERDERVGAVIGVTSVLRTLRYVAGLGDELPRDLGSLEMLAGDLEQLLVREPALQAFVDLDTISHTRLSVFTRRGDHEGYRELEELVRAKWGEAVAAEPALAPLRLRLTGQGPLQAMISHHLVPTLVESFLLTAGIIFVTFLLVFRNGAARLMAMIPSVFAILVMFGVMRLAGITLNVATILIASTVLGASENDQIHFFYHFLERRKDGSTEDGLRHTLQIAGRAIFFATVINAGGFLALALSDLPPMRQFGILSAAAFILSMVADFTALPAALWIFLRDQPDAVKAAAAVRVRAVAPGGGV